MTFTRNTIGTIRLNAGKLPVSEIAKACGVSEGLVVRIAAEQKIDLHLRVYGAHEPQPDHAPMSAHDVVHPHPRHLGPRRDGRTEQAMIRLFAGDARLIDAIGSAQGLRRGQTLSRIIENARDRGLIDELVRLPAPKPEGA